MHESCSYGSVGGEDGDILAYPASRVEIGGRCLNQGRLFLLGQVRREPDYWTGSNRRRGGVKRMQAFARNCGNQTVNAKGDAEAAKTVRPEYR
jgi:hypothetical protein